MEEIRKELTADELEAVTGGVVSGRETSLRSAGIELWKEYGKVPGEFGNIRSGDYYFKGQKITQREVAALEYYSKVNHTAAPDLQTAMDHFKGSISSNGRII